MSGVELAVQRRLFELQDVKYREFQSRLMPTVDPETVIGVRMPELRRLAREFSKTSQAAEFLNTLPHRYYEENNLHGLLLERIDDYDRLIAALDTFLPYVDNWATCDLMRPRAFKNHLPELVIKIREWLVSGSTYTVRFGIEMLMSFYLDGHFKPEYLELVASIRSQEYYVNMMIAWYFATALAKQYDAAILYIEGHRLEGWAHNKTIQKAIESYRITDEQKEYLRTLKV
jgi:3-methyladenine DNA glycosylase AlkD